MRNLFSLSSAIYLFCRTVIVYSLNFAESYKLFSSFTVNKLNHHKRLAVNKHSFLWLSTTVNRYFMNIYIFSFIYYIDVFNQNFIGYIF